MPGESKSVTRLLQDWRGGDPQALDQLVPVVYESLHKMAGRCLRSERPGNTLSSTALVHEAYLRLVDADVAWNGRVHFYAVSARVMRRILIDHAKSQGRAKRGGGERVAFDEAAVVGAAAPESLLELDAALSRLAAFDHRRSEIVELLFFGGLTYDEVGEALAISRATVDRELRLAKAWLHRELSPSSPAGAQP
ncbi:MAG TPA: sigma-70 family RNA polymerase sigma factor [Bryobacteraceae bacterium]|jgi:RNA polymerase sigma factor (TIGR02999 family)|nr:sigma-70 family RNA polymerase sigma factor [Bryobacteraceae bacterium]